MLIFNPRQMAITARERKVGKGVFTFCIFLFVILLITALPELLAIPRDTQDYLGKVLLVVGFLGELLIAYIANNKGDGHDYWYRYINIRTPISIPVFILGSIIAFSIGFLSSGNILDAKWYALLFSVPLYLILYIALFHYMKIASRGR